MAGRQRAAWCAEQRAALAGGARARTAAAAHHKNIARVRALAAITEELEQVVELPMNVTTDRDGALHRLHGALLQHELLHVLAQVFEVALWQQLAVAHRRDPRVQVAPHRARAQARAAGQAHARKRDEVERVPLGPAAEGKCASL